MIDPFTLGLLSRMPEPPPQGRGTRSWGACGVLSN
jgi:hypothetical protein